MLVSKKRDEAPLFIRSYDNKTLVYYIGGRIEILKMSALIYIHTNGYKDNVSKYKPNVLLNNVILFPTHSFRNKSCSWINANIMFDYQFLNYYQIIIDYGIDISIDRIIKSCIMNQKS